jgi:hypothetical protein
MRQSTVSSLGSAAGAKRRLTGQLPSPLGVRFGIAASQGSEPAAPARQPRTTWSCHSASTIASTPPLTVPASRVSWSSGENGCGVNLPLNVWLPPTSPQ